jgi:hypothetical protein
MGALLCLERGPLVSTPLRRSLQPRRRGSRYTAEQNRLSWTLGGRSTENSVRSMESRQRWSLQLDETSSRPPSLILAPSSSASRLAVAASGGQLSGSPWSPRMKNLGRHRQQQSPIPGSETFRESPALSRGRPHSAAVVAAMWGHRGEMISPVVTTVATRQPHVVLPELHTSALIEHGDDPDNVQSVEAVRARSFHRFLYTYA